MPIKSAVPATFYIFIGELNRVFRAILTQSAMKILQTRDLNLNYFHCL